MYGWGLPNIPIKPLPMEIDYSLSDYGFTCRLLKINHEQQAEIDNLKERVARLETIVGLQNENIAFLLSK